MTYDELPVRARAQERIMADPAAGRIIRVLTGAALDAREDVRDAARQLCIRTATWALPMWEDLAGTSPGPGQSLEQRRAAVAGRLSGRGTATEAYLRAVIAGLMQGEVTIEERFSQFLVAVHVTSDIRSGPNYDELPGVLRAAVPAHLLVECSVTLEARSDCRLYAGFCLRTARQVAAGCAVPVLDVALLADEDGNLLADERGLRLTEECDPYGV